MNIQSVLRLTLGLFIRPRQSLRIISASYRSRRAARVKSLLPRTSATRQPKATLTHCAFFTTSNAGDTLLPVAVRDAIDKGIGRANWRLRHAHAPWTTEDAERTNNTQGLVIGGGGLLLKDTNPNNNSGWQWNCPINVLEAIDVPIFVFAVGYNRFRNQEDFDPIFTEHLCCLADKAEMIGLRNHGSMRAVRRYLPTSLHHKVVYQPCPTTILRHLYPRFFDTQVQETHPIVAFNAAFDRSGLRFGTDAEKLLDRIARAAKAIESHADIWFVAHTESDKQALRSLHRHGVKYRLVSLSNRTPQQVISVYKRPTVTVGMRGHAQMIPFGCGRPIVSLVSHDKMQWFLDDTGLSDRGIEVDDVELPSKISNQVLQILSNPQRESDRIHQAMLKLWDVTQFNSRTIRGSI